jgi:hypothetical protein
MLNILYHKFSDHYTDYRFGYQTGPLFTRISVQDKRSNRAKMDNIPLDATEKEIKMGWYTLLKELEHATKAS